MMMRLWGIVGSPRGCRRRIELNRAGTLGVLGTGRCYMDFGRPGQLSSCANGPQSEPTRLSNSKEWSSCPSPDPTTVTEHMSTAGTQLFSAVLSVFSMSSVSSDASSRANLLSERDCDLELYITKRCPSGPARLGLHSGAHSGLDISTHMHDLYTFTILRLGLVGGRMFSNMEIVALGRKDPPIRSKQRTR